MPENDQQSGPNVVVLPIGRSLPGTPTDEKVPKQRGKVSNSWHFLPVDILYPINATFAC